MKISLATQTLQYYNDICEIIRLFYGMPVFSDSDADISVTHTVQAGCNSVTINGKKTIEHSEAGDDSRKAVKICVYHAFVKYTGRNMPWGSLTGVRPVKLFHELGADAYDTFLQTYDVSPARTELTKRIAENQFDIINSVNPNDIDIYIHIPFCKTRCAYCSFSSIGVEKKGKLIPAYMDALIGEIQACGDHIMRRSLRAIYIGGGTPTALPPDELDKLLTVVNAVFGRVSEFTVEAGRADTIDREKLDILSARGVSRISINPQTMNARTLETIGRAHSPEDVIRAFALAKDYDFIINADVIAGLPGESVNDMRHTLEALGELQLDNITVHSLSLKRASAMRSDATYEPWENDCVGEMLDIVYAFCESIGMHPYYLYRQKYMAGNFENTGFAQEGTQCVYNVDIMQENVNILALGCNAISKRVYSAERYERIANPKDIEVYLERARECARRKIKVF